MPCDALLLERLHCDSGELLVHGYEVPKRPPCDSVDAFITGDALMIGARDRRLQCVSGELLILGYEIPERPLCDSMVGLVPGDALLFGGSSRTPASC